ncbi:MAG: cobalt ECF transporter T component CbiQ [Eubacteriales bacterium]
MIAIDKACYHSKLRYENPEQKILYGVITLLICVAGKSYGVAVVVFLVNTYLIVHKSGVAYSKYLHYMKIPLTFILLSTISIMINFSKQPLDAFAVLLPFTIEGSNIYMTSSVESFYFAGLLILTALASVTNLYFISLTTPMPDILMVMQEAKVPVLFVELMLLIYRYIFILLEVADNIHKAQLVRLGNKDYKTSIQSFGQLISVLFIRAMKKSNALYDAMEARGYDGRINVLKESKESKKVVTLAIVCFEIMLVGIIVLEVILKNS